MSLLPAQTAYPTESLPCSLGGRATTGALKVVREETLYKTLPAEAPIAIRTPISDADYRMIAPSASSHIVPRLRWMGLPIL